MQPVSEFELSAAQIASFDEDGFVVVDQIVDPELVQRALGRFEPLFAGEFETGLYPDEWNWKPGRDAPTLTRQICNGWKSDRDIARIVLREDIGRACGVLGRWPGTRISQDNVLWKPMRGLPLGFHQDAAYDRWAVPTEWVSCWIALDPTTADGGTLELVRGSHRWRLWDMIENFHGPDDPEFELRIAAQMEDSAIDKVAVEVPPGGGVSIQAGPGTDQGLTWPTCLDARWSLIARRQRRGSAPTRSAISIVVTRSSAARKWMSRIFPSRGATTGTARHSLPTI